MHVLLEWVIVIIGLMIFLFIMEKIGKPKQKVTILVWYVRCKEREYGPFFEAETAVNLAKLLNNDVTAEKGLSWIEKKTEEATVSDILIKVR